MDGESAALGALGGGGPLGGRRGGRRGGLQLAGADGGARLLPLENGDLVAQLLVGVLELLNAVEHLPEKGEQGINQRRAFLRPNLGKLNLHASQCRKSPRDQLRHYPELWRCYKRRCWRGGSSRPGSRL